jgi:hypothetical protein
MGENGCCSGRERLALGWARSQAGEGGGGGELKKHISRRDDIKHFYVICPSDKISH